MFEPIIFDGSGLRLPTFSRQISVSVDRFNFGDKTPCRIFWQMEPPEVLRGITQTLIENHKFYDLILTWDAEVLSRCSNAQLFAYGGVWTRSEDTSEKKFAASMITSSKNLYEGHKFRLDIFDALPSLVGSLSITKHKSPPFLPTKLGLLAPYQYSVVMENASYPNYFTEKINDAMATKTIPIYWGAPNIGEFYNADGILAFQTLEELRGILKSLTSDLWASKQSAIEENYQKSLKYELRTDDFIAMVNKFLETR